MKKWFFLLLGLLYPVQASAAPDLSEIVVTATVLPSQVATVSSDVQIVTSRELRDSGARTVTEALSRFVPSNGKIQPGAYSSVGLRGFNSLSSVSSVLGDSVIILLPRMTEYIAMIVPRSHPQLDDIVNRFNEEVEMFNELKP